LRHILTVGAAVAALAGCATSPKATLAGLDRHDPQYRTRDCRAARAAAARYDDERNGRMVVALAGNVLVPFAGTAAAAAMGKVKDDRKRELNHRVRAACVSDPLASGKARSARR
jgi:hypothetical protein